MSTNQFKSFLLLSVKEWWAWVLGAIPVILTLLAAASKWRKDALYRAKVENRLLSQANTKLELEAKIRIDDLTDYKEQIDKQQVTIMEQRERIQRLINTNNEH